MTLDAFVFESDSLREAAIASIRLGDAETLAHINNEIRQQGSARNFPIILNTVLKDARQNGGEIAHPSIPSLVAELEKIKTEDKRLNRFKTDLLEISRVAYAAERPIVF